MKKLVLFILVVSYLQVHAQHQLYIGLESGPKWTFTENLTGLYNFTTEKQIGYSAGLVSGSTFSNGRFGIETGLTVSSFNFNHNMEFGTYPFYPNKRYWPENYVEPKLFISQTGFQFPLRIKSRLFQSKNCKWETWLTGGAALTIIAYGKESVQGNFFVNEGRTVLISRQIDENKVSDEMEFIFFTDPDPTFMLESGIETNYKINDRFFISFKTRYQGGLRPIFFSRIKDIDKSPRSGQYITRLTTTSNGSGIYLNLGISYNFSKQNSKVD